eukprot:Opistho-1_new@104056
MRSSKSCGTTGGRRLRFRLRSPSRRPRAWARGLTMGMKVTVPRSSCRAPLSRAAITRAMAPTPAVSLPCTAALTSRRGPLRRPANWWRRRWVGVFMGVIGGFSGTEPVALQAVFGRAQPGRQGGGAMALAPSAQAVQGGKSIVGRRAAGAGDQLTATAHAVGQKSRQAQVIRIALDLATVAGQGLHQTGGIEAGGLDQPVRLFLRGPVLGLGQHGAQAGPSHGLGDQLVHALVGGDAVAGMGQQQQFGLLRVQQSGHLLDLCGPQRGALLRGFGLDLLEVVLGQADIAEAQQGAGVFQLGPARLPTRLVAAQGHGHIGDAPARFLPQPQGQGADDALIVGMGREDHAMAAGLRLQL